MIGNVGSFLKSPCIMDRGWGRGVSYFHLAPRAACRLM